MAFDRKLTTLIVTLLFSISLHAENFKQSVIIEYLNTIQNEGTPEKNFSNFGIGYKIDLIRWISIRNFSEIGNKTYLKSKEDYGRYKLETKNYLKKICNNTYVGLRLGNKNRIFEFFIGPGISFSYISKGFNYVYQDTLNGENDKHKIALWSIRPSMNFTTDYIFYISKLGVLLGFEYKESKTEQLKNVTIINSNRGKSEPSLYVAPQDHKENCISLRLGLIYTF
jgi:hypothetical protein